MKITLLVVVIWIKVLRVPVRADIVLQSCSTQDVGCGLKKDQICIVFCKSCGCCWWRRPGLCTAAHVSMQNKWKEMRGIKWNWHKLDEVDNNWNTLNVCVRISPGLHKLLTMKKFKWEVIFKFDTQIIQMQFQNTPTSFLSKMSNDSQFCKIRN